MHLLEKECSIPAVATGDDPFAHLEKAIRFHLHDNAVPLRVAVTESSGTRYHCEVGVLDGIPASRLPGPSTVFRFVKRKSENTEGFNAVLIVPTGIGAEIGGHAGDATPVARLLAEVCDLVVTHPNVVNASDINESPANALYVEGSVISRLLMGAVGIQPVRSNRVLVAIDKHRNPLFMNAAINAVSAARASYGLRCPRVVPLDPPLFMSSSYTATGRAAGEVRNLEPLFAALELCRDEYDAVAISSVIQVPHAYHKEYFDRGGEMVNPWGGVEAMLTHAVSTLFEVPAAHSPMFESFEISNIDPGIVDPRMAAEAISLTFLQCILKGLHRSPRIVNDGDAIRAPGVLTVADISCLVIPDGCLGLPTFAALHQGITVIAVRENRNLMRNDLAALPWAPGQLQIVENYWEAVGVLAALKAGIDPAVVRRPLAATVVGESRTVIDGKTLESRSNVT